jgi:hypothetical protein
MGTEISSNEVKSQEKKSFKAFTPRSADRELTKSEKKQLGDTIRELKRMNKGLVPYEYGKRVANPTDIIGIGNKVHAAKFKKDQPVIWRGAKFYVAELTEPHLNEPDLKAELRDWGYGLREFNGKRITAGVCESDLKSLEEAAQAGLSPIGV